MKEIVMSEKAARKSIADMAMATALPLLQLLVGVLLTASVFHVPLPMNLWLSLLLPGAGLVATGSRALIRECRPSLRPHRVPRGAGLSTAGLRARAER